jgi:HEAT repeat protein
MPKSPKLDALQASLNQIRAQPHAETAAQGLREALDSKQAIAITQAARIIRDAELHPLLPALVTSFEQLLQLAVADPNCLSKQAIIDALYRLDYRESAPFLAAIRHRQPEAAWGGQVDTAAGLRAVAALGLVRVNYPDLMSELADLLADPESDARIGAVRACGYSENIEAVPLLRLKVQLGDEATVLAECYATLLRLAPTPSLPLVSRALRQSSEISEMAALALGESRLPAALPILQQWWRSIQDRDLRQTALLAIAMLRHTEAIEFLLSLVAQAPPSDMQAAVAALGIYAEDRELADKIQALLAERGQP